MGEIIGSYRLGPEWRVSESVIVADVLSQSLESELTDADLNEIRDALDRWVCECGAAAIKPEYLRRRDLLRVARELERTADRLEQLRTSWILLGRLPQHLLNEDDAFFDQLPPMRPDNLTAFKRWPQYVLEADMRAAAVALRDHTKRGVRRILASEGPVDKSIAFKEARVPLGRVVPRLCGVLWRRGANRPGSRYDAYSGTHVGATIDAVCTALEMAAVAVEGAAVDAGAAAADRGTAEERRRGRTTAKLARRSQQSRSRGAATRRPGPEQ